MGDGRHNLSPHCLKVELSLPPAISFLPPPHPRTFHAFLYTHMYTSGEAASAGHPGPCIPHIVIHTLQAIKAASAGQPDAKSGGISPAGGIWIRHPPGGTFAGHGRGGHAGEPRGPRWGRYAVAPGSGVSDVQSLAFAYARIIGRASGNAVYIQTYLIFYRHTFYRHTEGHIHNAFELQKLAQIVATGNKN